MCRHEAKIDEFFYRRKNDANVSTKQLAYLLRVNSVTRHLRPEAQSVRDRRKVPTTPQGQFSENTTEGCKSHPSDVSWIGCSWGMSRCLLSLLGRARPPENFCRWCLCTLVSCFFTFFQDSRVVPVQFLARSAIVREVACADITFFMVNGTFLRLILSFAIRLLFSMRGVVFMLLASSVVPSEFPQSFFLP